MPRAITENTLFYGGVLSILERIQTWKLGQWRFFSPEKKEGKDFSSLYSSNIPKNIFLSRDEYLNLFSLYFIHNWTHERYLSLSMIKIR